jgi:endonuclease YncB( thermonuclease family)
VRFTVLSALLLTGCWYTPPEDLRCDPEDTDCPLLDEVPIVGPPVVGFEPCAPEREESVACVLDGDTFDVEACGDNGERIRMLGIDAPEVAHGEDPAECWGYEASAELERLLTSEDVLLTFDWECEGIYNRTLAYVWLEQEGDDSLLVNQWMLEEGHARLFEEDFGQPIQLKDDFEAAQDVARARGLGLWGACPGEE